ncbi:unnamed protein product [Lepidochelys kempii]
MLQNALLVGFTALSSACLLRGFVQGDSVLQSPLEVTVSEGYDVLLQCNFTIMSNSPNLFWYHQYPNQAPQHILTAYKSPEEKSASTSGKLSNVLLQYNKTVPLKIEAVSLQNRAVYHCALRPTLGQSCVSGNKRSERGAHTQRGWQRLFFYPTLFYETSLINSVPSALPTSGRKFPFQSMCGIIAKLLYKPGPTMHYYLSYIYVN